MNEFDDPGHGHSPAAWTAVTVMLLAFVAGTVFFILEMPALVWGCVGLLVLGIIIGKVMASMGYGASNYQATTHAENSH